MTFAFPAKPEHALALLFYLTNEGVHDVDEERVSFGTGRTGFVWLRLQQISTTADMPGVWLATK